MKRNELIMMIVALSLFVGSRIYSESRPRLQADVMNCHDGDTCHVKLQGTMWINVRLAGIDAPEVSNHRKKNFQQPYGNEARDYLNGRLRGKQVELGQVDLDAYNRPVVEIFMGGVNINQEMITKGMAEAYRGKVKRLDQAGYIALETTAKQQKIGIWQQANYVSPAEFRKTKKD